MFAVKANTSFVHQSCRERVRIAERRALGIDILISRVEAATIGNAGEWAGNETGAARPTVAAEKLIFRREIFVDTHIESVHIRGGTAVCAEVVVQAGLGGSGHEIEQFDGIWIEPVGRNDFAGERR